MKSIFRLLCLLLMLSGWVVAGLSIYVIRTPDPNNPQASKLIVVPKNRLDFNDTYVDADMEDDGRGEPSGDYYACAGGG